MAEENHSLFQQNQQQSGESGGENKTEQPPPRSGGKGFLWKTVAIAVVVLAAIGTLALKQSTQNDGEGNGTSATSGDNMGSKGDLAKVSRQPENDSAEDANSGDSDKSFPPDTVLATVNDTEITLKELENALQAMPERNRASFKNRRHAFLDQLISKKLLLQEARTQETTTDAKGDKAGNTGSAQSSAENENATINNLLQQKVLGDLEVTDKEIRDFYEKNQDQMPAGRSYEELKTSLRRAALQEKQRKAVDSYIKNLRDDATISRNDEWIEAQKKSTKDNPLDNALAKDVPVLADFGRGKCKPCEMMKPILKKMKKDYKGKAEILIIDVGDFPGLARRAGVQAIPTQIFYDAEGNEVSRHQGFMSREKMDKRLKEMGVE